ncbi:VOC family protein [Fulvivirga lutimaris]|uniref:VOC family protein n=1 Tax=Fulvivirga lutimaris TaxID=1819566 RepID=UPI0012BBC736|nr:VOC family protein [Fulvivirga lutimaris]MTI38850.1 hypothetical protein [Fulvivirga lutimaris]
MDYKIEGMTIAITNMEAMLKFYTALFNIKFKELEMFNTKLYSGQWGELKLLFCPADIARNTATQNRHQFDIVVSDISKTIDVAINNGGVKMGEVNEDDQTLSVGIYDPDQNSITFKQLKN